MIFTKENVNSNYIATCGEDVYKLYTCSKNNEVYKDFKALKWFNSNDVIPNNYILYEFYGDKLSLENFNKLDHDSKIKIKN